MELLELLTKLMDCEYISDLHMMEKENKELHRCVSEIPIEKFSEREWIATAKYIRNMDCKTAEEAREALLAF